MMYNQKLVASLKANGKILREFKDTVYVPFGSEYSLLLKNLHTTRSVVNIFIDGVDMVPGGLVIDPGREINLERSIKNGNLTEGNKFKFIERTGDIEEHRGVKLEDGIVRIEFQYELPRPVINIPNNLWRSTPIWGGTTDYPYNSPTWSANTNHSEYKGTTDKFTLTASGASYSTNVGGAMRGVDFSKGEAMKASAASAASATLQSMNISSGAAHDGMATMDWNDAGITVPGSKSEQKFQHVTMGALEPEKHSIVLRMLGETPDNKPVFKPVTVKAKQKCDTCGHTNKATAEYCNKCGTALTIYA